MGDLYKIVPIEKRDGMILKICHVLRNWYLGRLWHLDYSVLSDK